MSEITKKQQAFIDAFTRGMEGIWFFSSGNCADAGCDEGCDDEGHFSWSSCDICGSPLGGDRYAAHGIIAESMADAQGEESTVTHFDVCANCVVFAANGDLPEDE
jgi:hypothetical protein